MRERCGNRAILVFPSNFVFVLMEKVASLGHLMRKIGRQRISDVMRLVP